MGLPTCMESESQRTIDRVLGFIVRHEETIVVAHAQWGLPLADVLCGAVKQALTEPAVECAEPLDVFGESPPDPGEEASPAADECRRIG